ncbi:putative 2OG-Fe(II) oxygenase [Nonomuraea sp. NPDC046802]|uniref:putative 2OG-Fe(II) oxygenase n=1 Tax=Nonomuraea sp. NPDC046802 TaxID=3154919 RepID=UPI00340D7E25
MPFPLKFREPHFHPNTALAAIYYVKAPGMCELDLMDPRPNIDYFDAGISLASEDHNVRLHCRPGDLVLIPGWLKHAVPAFEEPSERISISWNLGYTTQHSGQNRS